MLNTLTTTMISLIITILFFCCQSTDRAAVNIQEEVQIVPGAYHFKDYLPLLEDKRVAVTVNQTSMVGDTHLVDTLLSLGVDVAKVFAPEHGFRGTADAGEQVKNSIDQKTGLPIISLYGKNKKPTTEQLEDIDVILFDIQDVGVRFYTYISTMHYLMEAAAENGKTILILDRPNPHGSYIDGPVLQREHKSFVGMHPIPLVHGLTVGELALMINNEEWIDNELKADLKVIRMTNYHHGMTYSLPVKPSPNLPNDLSIALYPSLGLFEGTLISVGRGTYKPFQQIGHPSLESFPHTFIPESIPGMSKYPPYEGEKVYGISFEEKEPQYVFTLKYLLDLYKAYPEKEEFFNSFFEKLAGTAELRKQVKAGWTEEEIKESWKPGLEEYKVRRDEYLLYPKEAN